MRLFKRILGGRILGGRIPGGGHDEAELARRLGVEPSTLTALRPSYQAFTVPKQGGGTRTIHAPSPELKAMQRRILRRGLALLVSHPAAHGFEHGRSIATNAAAHVGRAVVARLDIEEFFPATSRERVEAFFRKLGWNRGAARRLTTLCTHGGGLPQGAPTSPRLSNLVNVTLDRRLDRLAARFEAVYTRYADDLVFSFPVDRPGDVRRVLRAAAAIARDYGYRVHRRKKRSIRRRHQHQRVTGLVVNDRVNLPRETRRRLRAAAHNLAKGRPATWTADQLRGWDALRAMVETQRGGG